MRNCLKLFKRNSGFTLIELLVVIGILGILAATLIATIDPFEQLKKGNDVKVQNAAVEFSTALIRYYTVQNAFPWDAVGTGCTAATGVAADTTADGTRGITPATPQNLTTLTTCIDELSGTGELKTSFKEAAGVLPYVFVSEAGNSISVCYQPTSLSGQKDKVTDYTTAGGTVNPAADGIPAACISHGGTTKCYWCTK